MLIAAVALVPLLGAPIDGRLQSLLAKVDPVMSHLAHVSQYSALKDAAVSRQNAIVVHKLSLMATVNSTQVAHDDNANGALTKYKEVTARLEAQKQLCDKCKIAEDDLIAALSAATTKHTGAQTKSNELVEAQTQYDVARSAWETERIAFAETKSTLACPALTVDDSASAFTAAAALLEEMKKIAARETTAKGEMTTKASLRDSAQVTYESAASEATAVDKAVVTMQEGRTTACAGLTPTIVATPTVATPTVATPTVATPIP